MIFRKHKKKSDVTFQLYSSRSIALKIQMNQPPLAQRFIAGISDEYWATIKGILVRRSTSSTTIHIFQALLLASSRQTTKYIGAIFRFAFLWQCALKDISMLLSWPSRRGEKKGLIRSIPRAICKPDFKANPLSPITYRYMYIMYLNSWTLVCTCSRIKQKKERTFT